MIQKCQFQSFDDPAAGADSAARVASLRNALKDEGLDGFLVPRADAHQGEYVPPSEERLAWLTGFTGSAGFAIVLAHSAAVFVDGRYTIQVQAQTDTSVFSPEDVVAMPPSKWLAAHAREPSRIGYDAWLMTSAQLEAFEKALAGKKVSLVTVSSNPIDAIWTARPPVPDARVSLYPLKFAGADAKAKLARIGEALGAADGLVISDPHAVAWTFNIRGGDVSHTPLPLSWAFVPKEGRPRLYIAASKLSNAVRADLENIAGVREPAHLPGDLEKLGAAGKKLRFDAATAPIKLVSDFRSAGGDADVGADPVALMKACKSAAEIRGSRAAHLRDGAALCKFLAWFDASAPSGQITEIDAACALETFRRETRKLKDVSFPTISAFGPHAASPHYRVTEQSDLKITKGIYLVDSGAQYEDGTTDVTRTLCVGKPSAEMRDRNTRVLKGHIAIARMVFPKGTSGAHIDAFARASLWQAGLDFDHGTGHGIGAYLSVHEGPQRIAKSGNAPLEPGMIVSNEPGFYKAGAYGIRIENLLLVEKRKIPGGDREMMGFETLTLAPISLGLIEPKLLSSEEIAWLDAYHARVRTTLSPKLDAETKRWLKAATRKIGARQ